MPTSDQSSPLRTRLRVLIADGMEGVRHDLSRILPLVGAIEVVGEAASMAEADSLAQTLRPDVVLVVLGRTGAEALELARRMRARGAACRVIGLALQTGPAERQEAQRAGIESLFVIGEPLEDLVDAICRTGPAGDIPKGDMP